MSKRWRIVPHDAQRIAFLERAARVSPVVAQLLLSRGMADPSRAIAFLQAKLSGLRDPELLPGIEAASELVFAAIGQKRRIMIYGDYDADGMTGTAILISCLRLLRANAGYYIPSRLSEGYGLNDDALRRLRDDGANVVITVDCGIASVEQAQTAAQLGLQLVITDHHQIGARLPEAAAIVHPRLPGSSYPFPGLCGAGVALKLAWALCQKASNAKRVSESMRSFLLAAVGLAAIGTVADVVPLVDENRLLVRHGLTSLRQQPSTGVAQLLRVTGLDQKPSLSSEDIAFTIAPRLNAAGRLGQAALAVELLTTDSPERAASLAEYLHELNKNRDSLERSIYLAARKLIKDRFDEAHDPAFVVDAPGWHAGVIGIVAGRLAEKLNAPVVLIARDQAGVHPGVGSARSACGVNLYQALAASGQRLARFGGHAAAAGLTIEEHQIAAFRDEFCEYVAKEVQPQQRVVEVRIDAEAPFSQLNLATVKQMESLAPFGMGNPRPVLCASAVDLAEAPKFIGGGERHLSLRLRHHGVGMRAVAFGQAEWAEPLQQCAGPIDVAYRPVINNFRGMQRVELQLVDWRPVQLGNQPSDLPLDVPSQS